MGYDRVSHQKAIQAALDETIGLEMIRPGESVYFKVNTNSGDRYPYSTSPRTILVVGEMLRDMGITDIRIGDRSFFGDMNTSGNFIANAIASAAQRLGTTAMVFDNNVDWMEIPPEIVPHWVPPVRLPVAVATANHILNMPCVKTHFISTFSMCLKNVLGVVHPLDRGREGNLKNHDTSKLYQQIAQINRALTPSLNILDGYNAVTTGGPRPEDGAAPTIKKPKVVIISTDRIAADVTGIAVLQTLSPRSEKITQNTAFSNPQITAALEAGIGIKRREDYDLSGKTVPLLKQYRSKALA